MRNLNEEYEVKQVIYEGQKRYRQTPEGKEALARANKKYRLKQKIQNLYNVSKTKSPKCIGCGETFLGFLTIDNDEVTCYNCKFGIDELEIEAICQ